MKNLKLKQKFDFFFFKLPSWGSSLKYCHGVYSKNQYVLIMHDYRVSHLGMCNNQVSLPCWGILSVQSIHMDKGMLSESRWVSEDIGVRGAGCGNARVQVKVRSILENIFKISSKRPLQSVQVQGIGVGAEYSI